MRVYDSELLANGTKSRIRLYGNTVYYSVDYTHWLADRETIAYIDGEVHPGDNLRLKQQELEAQLQSLGCYESDAASIATFVMATVERQFGWMLRHVRTIWPTLANLKQYFGPLLAGKVVQLSPNRMGIILSTGGTMTVIQMVKISRGRIVPTIMMMINDSLQVFPLGDLEDLEVPLMIGDGHAVAHHS
jgi:hypothetical protein